MVDMHASRASGWVWIDIYKGTHSVAGLLRSDPFFPSAILPAGNYCVQQCGMAPVCHTTGLVPSVLPYYGTLPTQYGPFSRSNWKGSLGSGSAGKSTLRTSHGSSSWLTWNLGIGFPAWPSSLAESADEGKCTQGFKSRHFELVTGFAN